MGMVAMHGYVIIDIVCLHYLDWKLSLIEPLEHLRHSLDESPWLTLQVGTPEDPMYRNVLYQKKVERHLNGIYLGRMISVVGGRAVIYAFHPAVRGDAWAQMKHLFLQIESKNNLWDRSRSKANDEVLSSPRRYCLQGLTEHCPSHGIEHHISPCDQSPHKFRLKSMRERWVHEVIDQSLKGTAWVLVFLWLLLNHLVMVGQSPFRIGE